MRVTVDLKAVGMILLAFVLGFAAGEFRGRAGRPSLPIPAPAPKPTPLPTPLPTPTPKPEFPRIDFPRWASR